jgi:hypothetical protein
MKTFIALRFMVVLQSRLGLFIEFRRSWVEKGLPADGWGDHAAIEPYEGNGAIRKGKEQDGYKKR